MEGKHCVAEELISNPITFLENYENQNDFVGALNEKPELCSRTTIKKELEDIDNYQADLASILYYTQTIQHDENQSLNREVKEESNIQDYYEKYDSCIIEDNLAESDSNSLVLNHDPIPPIQENGDCVVKIQNDYEDCNFKYSKSSLLKIHSEKHLRKSKKLRKNHLSFEDSMKPNMKLLQKGTKNINACYKKCSNCNYSSTDKKDWSQHKTLFHSKSLTQKCHLCEFNTISTSKFKLHMNRHTKKLIFKCQYCTYETVTASHLKRHINSIHTTSTEYPCRYCDFVATSFICLRRHIEEQHEKIVISGKINSQNEPKIQHISQLLKGNDTNVDPPKEVLARRARIIKGEKFRCQYCEYETPFSDYLNIHINSRHTQNVLYKCEYCEYNATKSYTLRCHVNSKHTKKVLYKCELCNLETTRSNILKRHIERIHVKKSFKCEYCEYVAEKQGYIRNHLKRKHGIIFKTDEYNRVKIELELIQIENIKFEPELVKCETV